VVANEGDAGPARGRGPAARDATGFHTASANHPPLAGEFDQLVDRLLVTVFGPFSRIGQIGCSHHAQHLSNGFGPGRSAPGVFSWGFISVDDVEKALSRYLKYVVALLIVELWRWISVGALGFQAAASSAVTSRQTAKRLSISVRH
jgi:hypothetical protein